MSYVPPVEARLAFVTMMDALGIATDREGLQDTPDRFCKAMMHHLSGYDLRAEDILKTFEDGAEDYDQMVLVRGIPVYSKCEHHLESIFGVAHVAYIPNKRIVGLSKINRLVDMYARRLQVQERLTSEIADAIDKHLSPVGVGVVLECRHMCMESRGVCQQGHTTVTSALRGALLHDPACRAEFMSLCRGTKS